MDCLKDKQVYCSRISDHPPKPIPADQHTTDGHLISVNKEWIHVYKKSAVEVVFNYQ